MIKKEVVDEIMSIEIEELEQDYKEQFIDFENDSDFNYIETTEEAFDELEVMRAIEDASVIEDDQEQNRQKYERGKPYSLKPGFLAGAERRVVSINGLPKTVKSTPQSTSWMHPGQRIHYNPTNTEKAVKHMVAGKKAKESEGASKLQTEAVVQRALEIAKKILKK